VFTQQPVGGVNENVSLGTQPQVSVEDANGNVVTGDSGAITLSINSYLAGNGGTTQGTLSCTTNPLNASSGVATFSGCKITGTTAAGTYTLSASHSGLIAGTPTSFQITAGTATQIVLSGLTANLASGASRTFTATVEDANGNTVTPGTDSTASINFAQTAGAGSVTGTGSASAVAGVATKSLTGSAAGSVTIRASATLSGPGATNSNTLTFSVTAGRRNHHLH
jgi:hypothetical protein